MQRSSKRIIVTGMFAMLVTAAFILAACAGAPPKINPSNHPAVEGKPMCSECHEDKRGMDHKKGWDHTMSRSSQKPECMVCHAGQATCVADCHSS